MTTEATRCHRGRQSTRGTDRKLPVLQDGFKGRAWRAVSSDLGYRRRKEDQCESHVGDQSRGLGSSLYGAGVGVCPKFRVRGAATHRERVSGSRAPLFGKELAPFTGRVTPRSQRAFLV